ncbi:Nitrogen assimilation transcription factor nirA 5 [Colletotrichum truncatum]|uniref:Nitrogen assimilation transcription factor nirA 5 n=1 Tax=Colletotrichum truncatum TaxID=5467 RepID=A0ACC3Z7J3_COLTU
MDWKPGPVHPVPEGQTNDRSATGLRRLLPAASSSVVGPSGGHFNNPPERLTKHTRHQVPAACLQCRKRKVKCSGERPSCHRCSQNELDCEWDTEPDTPRVVSIRKRKEELERENEDLHELLRFLHSRPEEEAVEIFKRLRESGDALQVLDFVRNADLLLQRRQVVKSASPNDSNRFSADVDDLPAGFLKVPARPWTTLANDGVVSELITGFFKWDEPFILAFVDREAFLEDMRGCLPETAKYCSSLLVNAICALRSHNSRRAKAYGHVNGCDMRSLFFEETKRLLDDEKGRTSLCTAQALFIMYLSAAAMGMDRSARMYQLAACDMVQHFRIPHSTKAKDEEKDRGLIAKALWGMYCFESILAFAYLRPSLLQTPPIPQSYISQYTKDTSAFTLNDRQNAALLNASCGLSIIFNNSMEYNGHIDVEKLGSEEDIKRRIETFSEVRAWRDAIPHDLQVTDAFYPPAYYLRAYEDQVIMSIFRPLKPDYHLPEDGYVGDLLLAYCERSIAGIEEYERALTLRDCSSMILIPLFNASVTLARLLRRQKTPDLFARACRLIRDRVDDFPCARLFLQGLLAMAAESGDEIPTVAKQHFEGLQLNEGVLRDVPISFVVPSYEDGRGGLERCDAGVQLGYLISNWSSLFASERPDDS